MGIDVHHNLPGGRRTAPCLPGIAGAHGRRSPGERRRAAGATALRCRSSAISTALPH
jgi:hypothetical protein